MTAEQIKNAEQTSQEIVAKNYEVFATESPLAVAKDVQGLRAIFDEVRTKKKKGKKEREKTTVGLEHSPCLAWSGRQS